MALSRDAFVEALQYRYDYYSARAVASEVLEAVGANDKAELSKDDVAAACNALAHDSRNSFVVEHIRSLIGLVAGDAPATPKAEAKADEKANNKAEAEQKAKAKADEKAEAKADKKAEAKADEKAKADKKAEAKPKQEAKAEQEAKAHVGGDAKVAPARVALVFAIKGAPEGQLMVVGNLPELGEWKPEGGLKLAPKGDVWEGGLEVGAGAPVEFKCVMVDGDTLVWEGGDNHKVVADPSAPRVEVIWQA